MLRNIVFAAFGAGLAVGLITAVLQQFTTTPLIIEAEIFESGGGQDHAEAEHAAGPGTPAIAEGDEEQAAWAPADGIERIMSTSSATVVIAVAAALMLLGVMVLRGGAINGRTGLAWGAAAFAAVSLAPAVGLPPELPGSAAADLLERQLWWAATVVVTAAGIGLMVFGSTSWTRAVAVLLIAAPHVFGAPHPAEFTSTAPAELAGHFAATSLGLAAVFWLLIGWGAASLFARLGGPAATRP